jgi:formylglycine-generating enzyme required for sulfatase activity
MMRTHQFFLYILLITLFAWSNPCVASVEDADKLLIQMRSRAESIPADSIDPILIAKSYMLNQNLDTIDLVNDKKGYLDKATELLLVYKKVVSNSILDDIERKINRLSSVNPSDYMNEQWKSLLGRQERLNFEDISYIDELDKLITDLDDFEVSLERMIQELAQKAETSTYFKTARFFYESLILLNPSNADAIRFIVNNTYAQGEVIGNSIGMQFTCIPAGVFTMGTPVSERFRDADENIHRVRITRSFLMSTAEVTRGDYIKVLGKDLHNMNTNDKEIMDSPACNVSWFEAVEFCRRLSEMEKAIYRLPTEAEWEYASRAGSNTPFTNDLTLLTTQSANIYDYNNPELSAVKLVKSNGIPNRWGLYDMHGNVWEWCQDWMQSYLSEDQVDPICDQISEANIQIAPTKVARGGSFDDDYTKARSGNRWDFAPSASSDKIGFRIVKEIQPTHDYVNTSQ